MLLDLKNLFASSMLQFFERGLTNKDRLLGLPKFPSLGFTLIKRQWCSPNGQPQCSAWVSCSFDELGVYSKLNYVLKKEPFFRDNSWTIEWDGILCGICFSVHWPSLIYETS